MSRTWQIALGTPANRRDVLEIVKRCRTDCGQAFGADHEAAISRLLVDAAAGRIYLIEVRGEVAGFVSVSFLQSVVWAARLSVIEKIYLTAAFQGRGLVQRVLRAVIGDLENLGPSIVVAYLQDSDPLVRLFDREGFDKTPMLRFTDQSLCEDFRNDDKDM